MNANDNQNQEFDIRSVVRQRYGELAAKSSPGAKSACCSPDQVIEFDSIKINYDATDVTSLPDEVTGLSLGCGDPVTLASLQEGQTVLDLGSGGGIDCFLAARRVGERGRVIGVDMTAEMVEKARLNQAKMGVTNVEFRLGEIEHLPVADNSVDVIISNCVINLSPDKPQVFREAFRVLKPEGRLAVSDIVTSTTLPEAVSKSLSAWAGCIAGALKAEDYVRAITQAGFEDVQLDPVYWDTSQVEEAMCECNLDKLEGLTSEEAQKAIFSAKVTARKPSN